VTGIFEWLSCSGIFYLLGKGVLVYACLRIRTFVLVYVCMYACIYVCTDMRRLTTGIRPKKCVVRRFRRCVNAVECTDTNLGSVAYYTPRLYGTAYCY
jgi:hypothetical protein